MHDSSCDGAVIPTGPHFGLDGATVRIKRLALGRPGVLTAGPWTPPAFSPRRGVISRHLPMHDPSVMVSTASACGGADLLAPSLTCRGIGCNGSADHPRTKTAQPPFRT